MSPGASMATMHPMDTQRVSWILLSGVSVPAVVTEQKDGTFQASAADCDATADGDSPNDALRELAKELDRRVERALVESRRVSARLETARQTAAFGL